MSWWSRLGLHFSLIVVLLSGNPAEAEDSGLAQQLILAIPFYGDLQVVQELKAICENRSDEFLSSQEMDKVHLSLFGLYQQAISWLGSKEAHFESIRMDNTPPQFDLSDYGRSITSPAGETLVQSIDNINHLAEQGLMSGSFVLPEDMYMELRAFIVEKRGGDRRLAESVEALSESFRKHPLGSSVPEQWLTDYSDSLVGWGAPRSGIEIMKSPFSTKEAEAIAQNPGSARTVMFRKIHHGNGLANRVIYSIQNGVLIGLVGRALEKTWMESRLPLSWDQQDIKDLAIAAFFGGLQAGTSTYLACKLGASGLPVWLSGTIGSNAGYLAYHASDVLTGHIGTYDLLLSLPMVTILSIGSYTGGRFSGMPLVGTLGGMLVTRKIIDYLYSPE